MSAITFKISPKLMSEIKYAFLTTRSLRANQPTLYIQGREHIIINPPTLSGDYLLSVRVYKDGRRNTVIGEMQ